MNEALKQFLVIAKQKTYAAGGEGGAKILTGGEKEYIFEQAGFKYVDRYSGHEQFSGREEVWTDNKLIWSMEYVGGILSKNVSPDNAYIFLRQALKSVPEDRPFRGPENFKEGDYEYVNKTDGDLNNFAGEEKIFHNNKLIYQLKYNGGIITS